MCRSSIFPEGALWSRSYDSHNCKRWLFIDDLQTCAEVKAYKKLTITSSTLHLQTNSISCAAAAGGELDVPGRNIFGVILVSYAHWGLQFCCVAGRSVSACEIEFLLYCFLDFKSLKMSKYHSELSKREQDLLKIRRDSDTKAAELVKMERMMQQTKNLMEKKTESSTDSMGYQENMGLYHKPKPCRLIFQMCLCVFFFLKTNACCAAVMCWPVSSGCPVTVEDLEEKVRSSRRYRRNSLHHTQMLESQMKTVKGELVGTLDHLQELRNVLRRSQQKAEERKATMEKLAAGLRWTNRPPATERHTKRKKPSWFYGGKKETGAAVLVLKLFSSSLGRDACVLASRD